MIICPDAWGLFLGHRDLMTVKNRAPTDSSMGFLDHHFLSSISMGNFP